MQQARILIVEDEAITLKHIQLIMRRLGYIIAGQCDRGEIAIQLASDLAPDLVLMDIGLGGMMDGIMAAAAIRTNFNIPVVFLTAHADRATLERAKGSEPFGYLTKPFQDSSLQATVEMALYKFQMEARLRESEARYHAVVSQTADGVLLVALDSHKILDANLAAQEMLNLNLDREDFSIVSVITFFEAELETMLAYIQKYGYYLLGERRCTRNDGLVLDLDLRASLIHYGHKAVLCIVMHDITAYKRVEQELIRTNQQLNAHLEEIKILHAELSEAAIRDPLTGLFNRRYLQELIQIEFSRAKREAYPIGFVMVDIDYFKGVNDTFGHAAGDLVLQALGAKLRGYCRVDDLVFRYGGDEFLLVLHKTTLPEAEERMEQLVREVQEMNVLFNNWLLTITLSVGVAVCEPKDQSIDQMIRVADEALYRAKGAGRNCVAV